MLRIRHQVAGSREVFSELPARPVPLDALAPRCEQRAEVPGLLLERGSLGPQSSYVLTGQEMRGSQGEVGFVERLLRRTPALGGDLPDALVDVGTGQPLKQIRTVAPVGLEQRREVTLSEQDRALEVLDLEPLERLVKSVVEVLLLPPSAEQGPSFGGRVPSLESPLRRLQVSAGFSPSALAGPDGAIAPGSARLDFGELHLGSAVGSPLGHDPAAVVGGQSEIGACGLPPARQPRSLTEQGEADRVEQGRLAGARRPDDEKERRVAEVLLEVHLMLPVEGVEVLDANADDLHDPRASAPPSASSSTSRKAASRSSSSRMPLRSQSSPNTASGSSSSRV